MLSVALFGCGGAPQKPPEQPRPPVLPKPAPVVETADLSPVAAPAGLFVVGRLKRPTALADTVAHWAGVPLGLRDVLPFAAKDLDNVLLWDAPVELAVAATPTGRKGVVETGVSVGLSGTEQALAAARRAGYEVKRLGPEVYAVGGTPHLSCAIAPAVGSAPARLVCSHRAAELEDLLPYMTRGLPNEPLGQRDLELELRAEPLRQRFATELGSARLFAGFVVRELQLDSPRFDTALSDAAYGLADELVALSHDVNAVRLEATVDDQKHVVELDASLSLGDDQSFVARVLADRGKHAGPPPEDFWKLPADAESAGYTQAFEPATYERLSAGIAELADAYLEHAKIGKPTRARVARLVQTCLGWDGANVRAAGSDPVPAAKGAKVGGSAEWSLTRVEHPPATLKSVLDDLSGILGDRELRALVARSLKVSDKELPSGHVVPLRGSGVPAGARALVVKLPTELGPLLGRSFGLTPKDGGAQREPALTVIATGSSAVVATAENLSVLAARVGELLAGKGATLATRSDLASLRTLDASSAGFFTLLDLLSGALGHGLANPSEVAAGLPNHASVPMLTDFTVEPQTGSKATWHLTVPAAVFQDVPGLVPFVAASVADHSAP